MDETIAVESPAATTAVSPLTNDLDAPAAIAAPVAAGPAPKRAGRPKGVKNKPKPPKPPPKPAELPIEEKRLLLQYFPELFLGDRPYQWQRDVLTELNYRDSRVALKAANGCIGGEQWIYDPVAKVSRRVDQIRGPFHVYAWDEQRREVVVAPALAPFIKANRDDLYELELSNGHVMVVSPGHRFLTPDGWREFGQMADGASILAPSGDGECWPALSVSTADTFLSGSHEDAHGSTQTGQDSPVGYQRDPHFCDALPRRWSETDQAPSPSLAGAHEHTTAAATACLVSHSPAAADWTACTPGAPGRKSAHSPTCQSAGHPASSWYDQPPIGVRGDGPESRVFGRHPKRTPDESYDQGGRSRRLPPGPVWLRPRSGLGETECRQGCSECSSSNHLTTVVKRRLLRWGDIWDFEVPRYHNYIAGGVVNHNSGKTDRIVARVIAWHMMRFPGSQTVVTAGVYRQVVDVLWPVMRNIINGLGGEELGWKITENKITYTAPHLDGQPPHEPAMCVGFSADKPESAEGWHVRGPSQNLLYIIDEAKAVADGIFDAMERCQPTRVLEVSSPGGRAGRFFERFQKADARYSLFTVTAYDCPHIKKEWIEQQIAIYGEKSPVIQSMIFAEFGDEDQNTVVLPLSVLQRAIASPPAKIGSDLRAGCDFAAGGDENVIQLLEGNIPKERVSWREKDTMAAVGRFITEFKRMGLKPEQIWGDAGGIGIPMCDALREAGWPINRVNNGDAAWDDHKFANRGTEMWVTYARMVETGQIAVPADDEILHRQLTTRHLGHNPKGKLMVESKDKMKERGLGSPDRADAMILAACGGGQSFNAYAAKYGKRVSLSDLDPATDEDGEGYFDRGGWHAG